MNWILLSTIIGFIGGLITTLVYMHFMKPKPLGEIILSRDGSLYIEMNNEESLNKIASSNIVTFTVRRE